ncbi:MAG: DsbA family protein [Pseudomonadales bacterium]|nr:DsbA family protein [Pseudomonadales bacterium]MBO7006124.1 DsbA family protein [Pseudomonadales bacterium]
MRSHRNAEGYEGKLLFMTDPICSWCWGTLPEFMTVKEALGERLSFELKCAGLQIGSMKPLTPSHTNDLVKLWRNVAETTGQEFAFTLPADKNFIYHSELACRTLQIARRELGREPWQEFHDMQRAFYVDAQNLGDLEVLYQLSGDTGLTQDQFEDAIQSEQVTHQTRKEFDWCRVQGTQALPTLFLDVGEGPKLVCGGYATADFLIPEISSRLTTH